MTTSVEENGAVDLPTGASPNWKELERQILWWQIARLARESGRTMEEEAQVLADKLREYEKAEVKP